MPAVERAAMSYAIMLSAAIWAVLMWATGII
jgi:hypothetical protein